MSPNFFPALGEAGCAKATSSGVLAERVLWSGSHASNFAGPQRVRSVWQLGKVMTPANLLHRCAQHEAFA